MLRTVWKTPKIMCLPKGNHSPTRRPISSDGTTKARPSVTACPVARYPAAPPASPHAVNPPAHWPGVLMVARVMV